MSNIKTTTPGNFHENTVQHLSLIQGVINRMGSNSGLMKGFAALIVTSSIMVDTEKTHVVLLLVLMVTIIALSVLDGYYLAQERRYRALYEKVRTENNNGAQSDFALKIDLKESEIKEYACSTMTSIVSKSFLPFYLPCLIFEGLVIFFKLHSL